MAGHGPQPALTVRPRGLRPLADVARLIAHLHNEAAGPVRLLQVGGKLLREPARGPAGRLHLFRKRVARHRAQVGQLAEERRRRPAGASVFLLEQDELPVQRGKIDGERRCIRCARRCAGEVHAEARPNVRDALFGLVARQRPQRVAAGGGVFVEPIGHAREAVEGDGPRIGQRDGLNRDTQRQGLHMTPGRYGDSSLIPPGRGLLRRDDGNPDPLSGVGGKREAGVVQQQVGQAQVAEERDPFVKPDRPDPGRRERGPVRAAQFRTAHDSVHRSFGGHAELDRAAVVQAESQLECRRRRAGGLELPGVDHFQDVRGKQAEGLARRVVSGKPVQEPPRGGLHRLHGFAGGEASDGVAIGIAHKSHHAVGVVEVVRIVPDHAHGEQLPRVAMHSRAPDGEHQARVEIQPDVIGNEIDPGALREAAGRLVLANTPRFGIGHNDTASGDKPGDGIEGFREEFRISDFGFRI